MGLFSYFRDRRASESAPSASAQEEAIPSSGLAGGAGQPVHATEVEGLGALGALFGQLQDMQAQGVSVSSSNQVIDMRGSGLREEIMGVIAAHGIDPNQQGQQVDASTAPALQNDILAVLSRAGIDVSGAGIPMQIETSGPREPEEPLDPKVPQIRNPLDR